MRFSYRLIGWKCLCGTEPLRVKVGISCFGELVASWHCVKCRKDILARIPLEDVIKDIPPPPSAEFTPDDTSILRDMHITLPDP